MKPLTRKEIFQDAIAKGVEAPIKPITREEKFMSEEAKREASGGGVTSWNDLTDRPFYEESAVICDDSVFWRHYNDDPERYEELGVNGKFYSQIALDLIVGNTYHIYTSFDDFNDSISGDFIAKLANDGTVYCGNLALGGLGEDTEENFFINNNIITVNPTGDAKWADGGCEGWLKITETARKTLDPKFLPEPLQFGEVWESVSYAGTSTDSVGLMYKVSDEIPSIKKGDKVKLQMNRLGEVVSGEYTAGWGWNGNGFGSDSEVHEILDMGDESTWVVIALEDNVETMIEGSLKTFPTKGVYFYRNPEYCLVERISWQETKPIDKKYLPKAEAVADVTEAPTAENFNALLASLRAAGYMNS